ncbi:MAG: hypothetical protein LBP71_04810 [Spirochaetaceae bacterium]|jgi:hypothetical protein|nr:hypothetical protein [Spirochaetaceae bacterium]
MSIYIFSSKKLRSLGFNLPKTAEPVILSPADLGKHEPRNGDISYLDISEYAGEGEIKKAAALLRRRSKGAAWGILDLKGESTDPAQFFFDGASDYLGPKLIKAGIDKKRLKAPLSWRDAASGGKEPALNPDPSSKEGDAKKTARLPGGKFAGWHSLRAGTTAPFFFLYVSLAGEGKANLRPRIGERNYKLLRDRLRNFLQQAFYEANALLWMETETNCLFLIPPKAEYVKAAITASLKTLMDTSMIMVETLGLSIPAGFVFALHYGKTPYRAPGKTGTVISDAVNFIFHLGSKCAEIDRLTLSGELPGEALAPQLADIFIPAGSFEGRDLRHSRRFVCSKQGVHTGSAYAGVVKRV